jgi:hypothetical protein
MDSGVNGKGMKEIELKRLAYNEGKFEYVPFSGKVL